MHPGNPGILLWHFTELESSGKFSSLNNVAGPDVAWKSPFNMSCSPVPFMWIVFEVSENIHTLPSPPPPKLMEGHWRK